MRRWSARQTSSPPRTRPRRAALPGRPSVGTCWPGWWLAAGAGAGWNQLGPMASRPTGAVTGTPVPRARTPASPKNTYVREDQILPHLAALAILVAGAGRSQDSGTVQVTAPAQTAALIDQLRASGTVLTYDPQTRTIRADG